MAMMATACAGPSEPINYAANDPVPLHEILTIDSDAVGETRTISVYTPPGYAEGAARYPVLYMPDGGMKEDFPHIANTIDALIAEGAIAPVMVVGIENTQRRRDLTPDSQVASDGEIAPMDDGAARFRAFIRDELIPRIDADYRTTGERAIVGESAAGLFIVDTFFREPDLFGRYIAMDPSIYWNDSALVRMAPERLSAMTGEGLILWFTCGDTPDIQPAAEALAAVLAADAPEDLDWTFAPHPEEHHDTIYRASKVEAFRAVLWKPEEAAR